MLTMKMPVEVVLRLINWHEAHELCVDLESHSDSAFLAPLDERVRDAYAPVGVC